MGGDHTVSKLVLALVSEVFILSFDRYLVAGMDKDVVFCGPLLRERTADLAGSILEVESIILLAIGDYSNLSGQDIFVFSVLVLKELGDSSCKRITFFSSLIDGKDRMVDYIGLEIKAYGSVDQSIRGSFDGNGLRILCGSSMVRSNSKPGLDIIRIVIYGPVKRCCKTDCHSAALCREIQGRLVKCDHRISELLFRSTCIESGK